MKDQEDKEKLIVYNDGEKDNVLCSEKKIIKNKDIKKQKIKKIRNISRVKRTSYKSRKSRLEFKEFNCMCNEIFSLSIFSISYILYGFSLEGCHKSEVACSWKVEFYIDLMRIGLFGAFFLSLGIYLILIRYSSFYHLVHLFLCMGFMFWFRHGDTFSDHGMFNIVGTILMTIFFLIALFLVDHLFRILFKKKIFLFFIITIIVVFPSIYIYNNYISTKLKCDYWDKGFDNIQIDNNKNLFSCTIHKPKKCYINLFENIFDLTKILNYKCSNRKKTEKYLLIKFSKSTNLNENTKRIGFPVTTHIHKMVANVVETEKDLANEIYKNLVDMDNKTKLKELGKENYPEIILDYTNNSFGEISVNLNYNETLSMERKKIEKKSMYNNILFFYMDAVSRVHFLQKLKKTTNFIKQFSKGKDKKHSFQFLKFHSFPGSTVTNVIPLVFGYPYSYNKGLSILQNIKERGYVTGQAQESCQKEPFWFKFCKSKEKNDKRIYIDYDHELLSLMCDPHYYQPDSEYPLNRGHNSFLIRCLYGKMNFEYQFEYANQFWDKYKNNKKFFRFVFNYGHEGTGEVIKYLDSYLYNFLNNLYINKKLDDTAIFFMSDHGLGMPGPYNILEAEDFLEEHSFPSFFLILPDSKDKTNIKQFEFMNQNQQTLITTFDIRDTLSHIIYDDEFNQFQKTTYWTQTPKTEIGESLFKKINAKERNCESYTLLYGKEYCHCRNNNIKLDSVHEALERKKKEEEEKKNKSEKKSSSKKT